jgi:hypothetical protein
MQLPPPDAATLFEELLQDLPPETVQMAREFKAFARARKIKTPQQLLRVVLFYCGLDTSLRGVAGNMTALYGPLTEQSVAERLRACGPWVKAVRRKMLPQPSRAALPPGWRCVVIDASSMQAPGATGIDYRLPISMDLVSLAFLEVSITDVQTGETLQNLSLGPGDVAVTDRGYAHAAGMAYAVARGAALLVRLHPFSVVLGDAAGEPLPLCEALKRQRADPIRTLPVVIRSSSGADEVRGWVHAYRLRPEQAHRARQACRKRPKKGAPKAETRSLAGWVRVLTTLSPEGLSPQPILAVYRCRWQVERAIKRWKSVLDVDALRANAQSPLAAVWLHGKLLYALMIERCGRRHLGESWSRLDQERVATWWRVWGMLKDEITPMVTGALCWKQEAWEACLKGLAERPRRRTLQQLPAEAIDVLYRYDERQQDARPVAA